MDAAPPRWTFLTNHAHVLLCVARDPGIRIRDIAATVGVTERAAHRMVADLVAAGYLGRARVGRRNHYEVHPELPLRHPAEQDHEIGELLDILAGSRRSRASVEAGPNARSGSGSGSGSAR